MNRNSEKLTNGIIVTSTVVGVLVLFLLMGLYGSWAAAFVGVRLWAWFVVPVFGLPLLTLPQAYGLSLLCHFWTWQHFSSKCKDERTWKEHLGEAIGLLIAPWFTLLVGWVCKAYFLGA